MTLLARQRRAWFQLRWPSEVHPEQLFAALAAMNGSSTQRRADDLVLLTVGTAEKVVHYLSTPDARSAGIRHQVEGAVPGLSVEPIDERPSITVDRAWRAWSSTRRRPHQTAYPEIVARGLLVALGHLHDDEQLVIQWVLGPVHRPVAVPARGLPAGGFERLRADVAEGIGMPAQVAELDPEARQALARKQGIPGWMADLTIGVRADERRRQRQLLGRLAAALRVAQGAGMRLRFLPARRTQIGRRRRPRWRALLVNIEELTGLAAWPIGSTADLAVSRERSRLLPPAPTVPSVGRIVGEAMYPGAKRPLALNPGDALHHLHVLGPTGTGKSTLLLNLICQDMAAGRSIVVIEPRGDLVNDVLSRVPDDRRDDVVVIDPTDPAPVGINPLAAYNVPTELRVDHLVAAFRQLFADSWGPRTQDVLTAGLLTLADIPGASLVALPLLFTDAHLRRHVHQHIHDPLALGPFWDWFEDLSVAERAHVLAPVMNKLRAFLLRARLRRVVGQAEPRFDLRDIYRKRTILLVNLATGTLGAESAALLGALVVSQLWQTILGRTAIAPQRRHPVMVFIDEFQTYLHLPTNLGEALTQARGLGVALTLAHQHLAQLTPDLQAAVLANARSRVVFATGHDDASIVLRSHQRIKPADIVGLGRYEVYASLLADRETTAFASAKTLPPPPTTCEGEEIRERSRARCGVPGEVVDVEISAFAANVLDGDEEPPPDAGYFGLEERDD